MELYDDEGGWGPGSQVGLWGGSWLIGLIVDKPLLPAQQAGSSSGVQLKVPIYYHTLTSASPTDSHLFSASVMEPLLAELLELRGRAQYNRGRDLAEQGLALASVRSSQGAALSLAGPNDEKAADSLAVAVLIGGIGALQEVRTLSAVCLSLLLGLTSRA